LPRSELMKFRKEPRPSVVNLQSKADNLHGFSTNIIDLTHDTIHELYWRPIVRKPELKPADGILRDKLQLKDWE
jgi:hypothetical protein